MITLNYEPDDDHVQHTAIERISMRIHDEATITEVLQAFKQFLSAVGYSFKIEDEIVVVNDQYV